MNLALSVALASATGFASTQSPAPAGTAGSPQKTADRSLHSVEAEIVSANSDGNTVTFKVDGTETTLPVGVLGRERLRDLKAGDRMLLTCKDRDGQHVEVFSIRSSRKEETDKAAAEKKAPSKE